MLPVAQAEKIRDRCRLHCLWEKVGPAQAVRQRGLFIPVDEQALQTGTPQVAIDQEGLEPLLSQGGSGVQRAIALPLPWDGTGEKDDFLSILVGQQGKGCAQRTERLRLGRSGIFYHHWMAVQIAMARERNSGKDGRTEKGLGHIDG